MRQARLLPSLARAALPAAAMLGLLAAPASAREPFDHAGLARQALELHIRPGYRRLAEASEAMAGEVDRYCRVQAGRKAPPREAFARLLAAWGRIEHIRIGPVARDRRAERILFWPDRQGLALRQVERLIGARDQGALDQATLAAKSVAVQGLTALEIALFGDTRKQARAILGFRCRYAEAIARNIAIIAREVSAEWQRDDGFAGEWLTAGPGNPSFLQPAETTRQLATAYESGLERLREERIAGPLGFNKQRRVTPVLFARSGLAADMLAANAEGLFDLFTVAGLSAAIEATGTTHESINVTANLQLVRRELDTVRSTLAALRTEATPFSSAQGRKSLIAVGYPLKNAAVQAKALLALTAGLTLGFNAADGD